MNAAISGSVLAAQAICVVIARGGRTSVDATGKDDRTGTDQQEENNLVVEKGEADDKSYEDLLEETAEEMAEEMPSELAEWFSERATL